MKLIFCALTTLALTAGSASAQDMQVFFGNLHSHTSHSDGSKKPKDAYRHARDKAKLDFLAITEHNHRQAGKISAEPERYNGDRSDALIRNAEKFTKDGRFIAIYVQEYSSISSGNHANVFDVGEVISSTVAPNGEWRMLVDDWLSQHKDSFGDDAIILLNHPANSSSKNDKEYGRDDFQSFEDWRENIDRHAQLINIINGPSHNENGSPGRPSESEFRRYLNLGFHLAPTADQDNHNPNWGSAADTRTAIIAKTLTKKALFDAMRNRHVYASEDANLSLIPTINGHLIGSIVDDSNSPNVGAPLQFELAISDPNEPFASYEVQIFSDHIGGSDDAGIIHRELLEGDGVHQFTAGKYQGGEQYVFLKIIQSNDHVEDQNRLWTAPVWFGGGVASVTVGSVDVAITLSVDRIAETARIENDGAANIDISKWVLTSMRGNQQFEIPDSTILEPSEAVIIVSGPDAESLGDNEIFWTTQNVWRNAGDPGQLSKPDGAIVASTN